MCHDAFADLLLRPSFDFSFFFSGTFFLCCVATPHLQSDVLTAASFSALPVSQPRVFRQEWEQRAHTCMCASSCCGACGADGGLRAADSHVPLCFFSFFFSSCSFVCPLAFFHDIHTPGTPVCSLFSFVSSRASLLVVCVFVTATVLISADCSGREAPFLLDRADMRSQWW